MTDRAKLSSGGAVRRRHDRVASRLELAILAIGFALAIVSGVVAYRVSGPYGERTREDPRVKKIVDPATGRLQLLIYDADGDGRFDTWSYMDGEKVLRMGVDENGDGQIDRWEYFGADGKVERVERTGSRQP